MKNSTVKEGEKYCWDDGCTHCGCWYCRLFTQYHIRRHSLRVPFERLWYWFPRFLWKKTYKGREGNNEVFKLWHGFYIWPIPSPGEAINRKWWKIVRFNYRFLFNKS